MRPRHGHARPPCEPGRGSARRGGAHGVDRIASIVRDLRFFGRDDDDPPGPIDLTRAIDAAERLVLHEIRPRGRLVKEHGELPRGHRVARHIEQVFVNLFLNAVHALDDKADGRIVVRSRVTDERVVVLIEDNGCGIPKETLDVVFEPFFTTRAGTGARGSASRSAATSSCARAATWWHGARSARGRPWS